MGDSPLVTVVVTGKNEESTIDNCIMSILNQSYPNFELIYVDAISSDKTLEKASRLKCVSELKKNCKRYVAIARKADTPGKGRNIGAEFGTGSILAFTDADCVAEKDWLQCLVLSLTPETGVVGGPNIIRNIRKSKVTLAINSVLSTFVGSGGSPQFYQITKAKDVYAVSTCNMAVKKEIFEKVGKFDESLRFNEDSEFCNRLSRNGFRIFYSPSARVNHFMGVESYSQFAAYFYKYGHERGKNAAKNYQLLTKFNSISLAVIVAIVSLSLFSIVNSIALLILGSLIAIFVVVIFFTSLKIGIINSSVILFFYAFSFFILLYVAYNAGFIVSYIFRVK